MIKKNKNSFRLLIRFYISLFIFLAPPLSLIHSHETVCSESSGTEAGSCSVCYFKNSISSFYVSENFIKFSPHFEVVKGLFSTPFTGSFYSDYTGRAPPFSA
jgi:hypothetical protein